MLSAQRRRGHACMQRELSTKGYGICQKCFRCRIEKQKCKIRRASDSSQDPLFKTNWFDNGELVLNSAIPAPPRPPRSHASRGNAYQDASRPSSARAWPMSEPTPTMACHWGDENASCFAATIPPGFIPPKLSRSLVRERRVPGWGGSPGVWGWFKVCLRLRPSSLYESQPAISWAA